MGTALPNDTSPKRQRESRPGPWLATQPGPSLATEPGPSLATQPGPSLATQPGPSLATQLGLSRLRIGLVSRVSIPTVRAATPRRRGISGQTVFLLAVVVGSCLAVVYVVFFQGRGGSPAAQPAVSKFRLEEIPFNGTRAYEYLKQLCALGSRSSGTPGMAAQQKILVEHFQKLGGQVELQRFSITHPLNGTRCRRRT